MWAWLVGVDAVEDPASPTEQDVAVANELVKMMQNYLETERRANHRWCRKFTAEELQRVRGLQKMKKTSVGSEIMDR